MSNQQQVPHNDVTRL